MRRLIGLTKSEIDSLLASVDHSTNGKSAALAGVAAAK